MSEEYGKTIQQKVDTLVNTQIYLAKILIDRKIAEIKEHFDAHGQNPDYRACMHSRYPYPKDILDADQNSTVVIPISDLMTMYSESMSMDDDIFFRTVLDKAVTAKINPLALYLNVKIIELRNYLGLPITTANIQTGKIVRE